MDQRFQAFILTAETLNMSRAAAQMFVSPQCVSGHIRSLEKEYGVSLFFRRPHLKLTEEGGKLLEMLYEMRRMENNISNYLSGAHSSIVGRTSLGIPSSRYSFLVPGILLEFKKEYPKVELVISEDFSASLTWQVERGTLDMAITAQQEPDSSLTTAFSISERFFFLVTERLLKDRYGGRWRELAETFHAGISLEECAGFPLILCPPTSRLRRALDQYSHQTGTSFSCVFETNHMELFETLCRTLNAGAFLSEQAFALKEKSQLSEREEDRVHAFPVLLEPLETPFNISLIHHRSAYLCDYKLGLIRIIERILTERQQG